MIQAVIPHHRQSRSRVFVFAALAVLIVAAIAVLPEAVASIASGAAGITTSNLAIRVGDAFSPWWASSAAPLTDGMTSVVSF